MANSTFKQFLFNKQAMMTLLEGSVSIGSSGAVSSFLGAGIADVVRLEAGMYKIVLEEGYNKFLGADFTMKSALAGSPADPNGVATNKVYVITTVGNTDWASAGLPSYITPAIGVAFKLTANPLAGTGRVDLPNESGIMACELVGNSNLTINLPTDPYLIVQTLSNTIAGTISAPTFSGTPGTTGSTSGGTPAGTNSAPVFTGAPLAGHSHTIPVNAGTAGDAVTNNAGVLESTGGQDLTTSSDTAGTPAGTVAAPVFTGSALAGHTHSFTPAGTNSAPTFTSTSSIGPANPNSGSQMFFQLLLRNSSVAAGGQ